MEYKAEKVNKMSCGFQEFLNQTNIKIQITACVHLSGCFRFLKIQDFGHTER